MNELPTDRPQAAKDRQTPRGFALWNLGFRPFYLLASLFSAFSVLLWAAQFSGYLPSAYLSGALWHGHEMLFGYATASGNAALITAAVIANGVNTTTRPAIQSAARATNGTPLGVG